ncbi:MAG: nicotinate (nicotinamide) nucleotide adenylyltransferase [Clostridium sp.]|nr:nicotinate (nicotinamide) nucleotide adenylyltransferase [Clostridium sp.]
MRIGIFGGAFNPVHNGHLFLLAYLSKASLIDKLILIPTANPPHKTNENFASAEDRFNMLSLAVKNNLDWDIAEKIEISDIEFKLEGKSYTYNTLCKMKELYPKDDLFLFMGSDQLLYFKNWYRYKDILNLASVMTIARQENEQAELKDFLAENQEEFHNSIGILLTKPIVVSSTDIRNRIKNKESIADLVPKEVEKYILEKGLYGV